MQQLEKALRESRRAPAKIKSMPPQPRREAATWPSQCFKCGKTLHFRRDCPISVCKWPKQVLVGTMSQYHGTHQNETGCRGSQPETRGARDGQPPDSVYAVAWQGCWFLEAMVRWQSPCSALYNVRVWPVIHERIPPVPVWSLRRNMVDFKCIYRGSLHWSLSSKRNPRFQKMGYWPQYKEARGDRGCPKRIQIQSLGTLRTAQKGTLCTRSRGQCLRMPTNSLYS